jgi:outer membrane protein OmpA-like peptidoglycan-associated protein
MLRQSLIAVSGLVFACVGSPTLGVALAPPAEASRPAPEDDLKTGPIINPVNFESGSTTITDPEVHSIFMAAGVMKGGDWTVMLVGLADASGDPATNKALTQQRCDVVAAELNKLGIPDTRIVIHAIGERLATDPNNVRERKVEFVFYTGGAKLTPRDIVVRSRVMEADFHHHEEDKP